MQPNESGTKSPDARPKRSQREIDFARANAKYARGQQLAALRDAELPHGCGHDGSRVKPLTLKAVLRAIDDYGRGREAFPSQKTLARNVPCSQRTICRAIQALESLGLLIIRRRWIGPGARTLNHYVIVWSELALLCPRRQPASKQRDMTADQSANETDQSAVGGSHNRLEAQREPPPPTRQPKRDGAWQVAVEDLKSIGLAEIDQAVRLAQRASMQPDDVRGLIVEYRSNSRVLRGPGALLYRIRRGTWPVTLQGTRYEDPGTKYEVQRTRMVKELRAAGLSSAEIDAEIEQRLGKPPYKTPPTNRKVPLRTVKGRRDATTKPV